MTTLLLVRHGETDWNAEGRLQGHTDRPLSDYGRRQAQQLAGELEDEDLEAIYSSDLERARATAEAVARSQGLEVLVDPDLREKNFGSWEGLTDVEIAQRLPDAVRGGWGDGETSDEVATRVLGALERIRSRHNGAVLVVAHGGSLRSILAHLGVEHGRIGNCELFRVRY